MDVLRVFVGKYYHMRLFWDSFVDFNLKLWVIPIYVEIEARLCFKCL